jgi:thioredoxin-like negative regulator of GroEL
VVDCTKEATVCQELEIAGYPTLFLFTGDSTWHTHSGNRDLQSLVEFVVDNSPPDILGVMQLTGDNFEAVIGEGLVFVLYYTPQCNHCTQTLHTWEELSRAMRFSVTLAKVTNSLTLPTDALEHTHTHNNGAHTVMEHTQ